MPIVSFPLLPRPPTQQGWRRMSRLQVFSFCLGDIRRAGVTCFRGTAQVTCHGPTAGVRLMVGLSPAFLNPYR